MSLGYIYRTTCKVNGRQYIGQSRAKGKPEYYLGSGVALTKAIAEHGRDNFTKEILSYHEDQMALDAAEVAAISEHRSKGLDLYNRRIGGSGAIDPKPEDHYCYGKKLPESTRAKIAEKTRERAAIRKAQGKPGPNAGKTFSKEWREKIAKAGIGRPPTNKGTKQPREWVEKMRAAITGRTRSPEHIEKFKKAQQKRRDDMISKFGYSVTPEQRQKISETMKRRGKDIWVRRKQLWAIQKDQADKAIAALRTQLTAVKAQIDSVLK